MKTRKNAGQGMTEYLIIVALIAISAIGIVKTTSSSMKAGFGTVANQLQGNNKKVEANEKVTDGKTKGRDMGDFSAGN
jgi:pilus assembly protein Flp/PilA